MKVSTNRIAEGKIYLSAINHGCSVLLLKGKVSELDQILASVTSCVNTAMSDKVQKSDTDLSSDSEKDAEPSTVVEEVTK